MAVIEIYILCIILVPISVDLELGDQTRIKFIPLECGRGYNVNTHYLFVDFKSAYDSISRAVFNEALMELGIPVKLNRLKC